jgi:hypothetical protein
VGPERLAIDMDKNNKDGILIRDTGKKGDKPTCMHGVTSPCGICGKF